MKAALIILSLLVVGTGSAALKNFNQMKQVNGQIQVLENRIQALTEQLDMAKQDMDPSENGFLPVPSSDSGTAIAEIPEEVVEAIAMQLARNTTALGAIAKGISATPSSTPTTPVDTAVFDQQVRDTIASVRDEERMEREQQMRDRMQDRAEDRANRMAEELGLTGTRADQFTSLLLDHSANRMDLISEARELGFDRGGWRGLFDQSRTDLNADVEQILTPTQYEAYLEMPQDTGGGRRGGGWGGGGSNNSGGSNDSGGSHDSGGSNDSGGGSNNGGSGRTNGGY